MRERLGASEAEVERAEDDETPVAAAMNKLTAKSKNKNKDNIANKNNKQQRQQQQGLLVGDEDELDDDDDEDDDDGEDSDEDGDDSDGGAGGAGRKVSTLRKAVSPGKGHGLAAAATEDIIAPDMVEDLGAWSDNEWA